MTAITAAAPAPLCPINVDATQVTMLTFASKQHEQDIQQIKNDHLKLADKMDAKFDRFDSKFDRLHFWIMGILAAALGGVALNVITLMQHPGVSK